MKCSCSRGKYATEISHPYHADPKYQLLLIAILAALAFVIKRKVNRKLQATNDLVTGRTSVCLN